MPKSITPNLWFDTQAEEAAEYYCSIFPDSRVVKISHYTEAAPDKAGQVLTVDFELQGQRFTALNGGPLFKFSEAISLQIFVDDQKELDYYWDRLTQGGDPKSHVCGWLKDKYGLSWQVVPKNILDWWVKPDEKSQRAFEAMMHMGKLDIAALERAYNG